MSPRAGWRKLCFALALALVSTTAAECPLCYEAARQMMTEGVQLDSSDRAVLGRAGSRGRPASDRGGRKGLGRARRRYRRTRRGGQRPSVSGRRTVAADPRSDRPAMDEPRTDPSRGRARDRRRPATTNLAADDSDSGYIELRRLAAARRARRALPRKCEPARGAPCLGRDRARAIRSNGRGSVAGRPGVGRRLARRSESRAAPRRLSGPARICCGPEDGVRLDRWIETALLLITRPISRR